MLNFKIDGKLCQLPTEWHELSEKQVYLLLPFLYCDKNLTKVRMAVFRLLFPIKSKLLKRIAAEDIFRLHERCLWVWEKPVKTTIRSFEFQKQLFMLPDPEFENVSLIEYGMADHYFRAFGRKRPDASALDNLVATLCRPQKANLNEEDPEWDGDNREKYNSKLAERRAAVFRELPVGVKMLLLQQFITGQKTLQANYKEIYQEPEPGTPKPSGPNFGWIGVIDDLARDGVFGDWEKTAFTNIHTVCFHLRKNHYRLKDMRRQNT